MTKQENFTKKINNNNQITKNIAKMEYYSTSQFFDDCLRYVKAIKDGRMICNIDSVSSSGMSRNIKFLECSKNKTRYSYLQFHTFFTVLGYTSTGRYKDTFRISGCGMDMIFHTNYSIMHTIQSLGIINKKQLTHLAQQTPDVI